MKAFYKSKFLPSLAVFLILIILVVTNVPSVNAGSNNNAFIITTVDNIKGQYSLLVFQTVCSSEAYEEYEFIVINGSEALYNKSCICEKYEQFDLTNGGDPWIYKQKFWKMINDCEVPYIINDFNHDVHGGVKGHQDTPENDRDLHTKFSVSESGELFMNTEFSVYPNPAKDYFIFDYQLRKGDIINMHLYDALGKEVNFYNNNLSQVPGLHAHTYDISDLPGGVYFYVITINDKKKSGRLIISD